MQKVGSHMTWGKEVKEPFEKVFFEISQASQIIKQ